MQGERDKQALDLDAMDGVAETLDDDARRAHAAHRRADRAHRMAAHAKSEQWSRRALALSDQALAQRMPIQGRTGPPADLLELRLFCLRTVGQAVMHQGRLDEAQRVLLDTLHAARTLGFVGAQARCINALGILAERRDDRVGALALFREGLDLDRQVGNRRNEAIGLGNVGLLLLALRDVAGAQRDLDAALQMIRQNGDRAAELPRLQGMSALMLWQGDIDRALALARSALECATALQARDRVVSAWVCLADAQASLGQHTVAAQAYADARVLGEELGRGHRFDASAGLARLLLAQGEISGAVQALQPLLSSDPTFPGAEWPRKIELTMYQVLAAAGDPRAAEWLQRAHHTLMAKADAITDMALRQMFLTNIPHHVEIAALWSAHRARLSSPPHEGFGRDAAGR